MLPKILQFVPFILYVISSINGQCTKHVTTAQFYAWLSRISECQRDEMYVFRQSSDLIVSLYDDDDRLTGSIDEEMLNTDCSNIESCKTAILNTNTCDDDMKRVVNEMSTALCSGRSAKTAVLNSAVNNLKSSGCTVEDTTSNLQPSGCHINEEGNTFTSYLTERERESRRVKATQRCLARYYDAYGSCSDANIMDHARLIAASGIPEYIGSSYAPHTDYKSQFNSNRVTKSIFGLTEITDSEGSKICYPQRHNFAIWTTYFYVTVTTRKLNPMNKPADIMSMTVSLSNNDGITMAEYLATAGSDLKPEFRSERKSVSMTDRLNGGSSFVDIKSEDGKIVIYHSVVDTSLIIFKSGDGLGLTVRAPSELLDSEGLGLLVEECDDLGGETLSSASAIRDVVGEDKANECINLCSSSYKANKRDLTTCLLSCSYDLDTNLYQEAYKAESLATKDDDRTTSAANHLISATTNILASLLISLYYLFN